MPLIRLSPFPVNGIIPTPSKSASATATVSVQKITGKKKTMRINCRCTKILFTRKPQNTETENTVTRTKTEYAPQAMISMNDMSNTRKCRSKNKMIEVVIIGIRILINPESNAWLKR